MDLNLLREFVCLSEDLSFTRAAERCFISQPVLSRHVQALETELGCELLVRSKKGVRLTPYGEAFAESCKAINAEYARMLSQLDSLKSNLTDDLRVSCAPALPHGFIDAAYDAYLERYPNGRLDLKTTWEENAFKLLEQGKVDLAICLAFEKPCDETYSSLVLFEDQYVALVSKEHPLSTKKKTLSLKDLEEETVFIPSSHDFPIQNSRIMEAVGEHPKLRTSATLNNKHDAVALANASRGITLACRGALEGMDLHSLVPIPLSDDGLNPSILAVWKSSNTLASLSGFVGILDELKSQERFRLL